MALGFAKDILVGVPDQNGWTFVYDSTSELLTDTGVYLSVLFSFETRAVVDVNAVNRKVSQIIQNSFFINPSKTTFNLLKSTSEDLRMYLHQRSIRVSFSAVAYDKSAVFVSAVGGADILVYRNGGLSKLLESNDIPVVASGYPKAKDTLILTTATLTKSVSIEVVEKAVRMSHERGNGRNPSLFIDNEFDASVSSAGVLFFTFIGDEHLKTEAVIDMVRDDGQIINQDQLKTRNVSVFSGISGLSIRQLFSRNKGKDARIMIEPEQVTLDETKKKTSMTLGIVIMILLVVSIVFGFRKQQEEELKLQYQPRLERALYEYEEALTMYSLSPERSRNHFQESFSLVEALLNEGVEDESLLELNEKLSNSRGKILGEYYVNLETYLDLSLKSDKFEGDDLFMSDETLYVLDKETERVISVSVESKTSSVVAGPGAVTSPHFISAYVGRVYVSSNEGFTRVDSGKQIVIDEPFSDKMLPYSYTGNVYVVDTNESKIWRHAGFDGGVADKVEWLVESAKPDLTKIVSLAIDGSIWMVSSSGGIFKFSLGNQVNFSSQGVFPALVNPTQIYTNDELTYLYVLEPSQKRIVVMTKEGGFVAQYISDSFSNARDFGVSEIENKLYVLTGSRIESAELGHL